MELGGRLLGCTVSLRIVWVKVKIGGWKLAIVSVYEPDGEDVRTEFWESLPDCIKEFVENERLIILGDLNSKVGKEEIDRITGKWGVSGTNVDRRLCRKRLDNLATHGSERGI